MTEPTTRVLMIEDEIDYAHLLAAVLSESADGDFEVGTATSLTDGLELIVAGAYDVVLLDLRLPDSTGVNTVDRLRRSAPDMPILVISGIDDEDVIFEAMQRGAQDYLVKGQSVPHLLARSILYAVQRKQAENALRESEERYRLLVESSIQGIGVSEGQKVVFANRALLDIFGYNTLEEIRKISLLDLVAPESRAVVEERLGKRVAGESNPPYLEFKALRRDGTTRDLEGIVVNVLIDGETHALGTFRDITDSRRAYDIVNSSPVVAFLWRNSPHFPVEFVSANVEDLLGYTAEDFTSGRVSWPGITHPEDDARLRDDLARRLRSGVDEFMQEYRLRTKSGETVWIEDQTTAIKDTNGNITHYQGLLFDCTERKQAEEKIKSFSRKVLAAREEERRNLANVLHHETGSYAVGLNARLGALEEEVAAGRPKAALEAAGEARALLDQFIASLKGLASDVRPPDLDILGLLAALRQFFIQFTANSGVKIRFTPEVEPENIGDNSATVLFRIAQECLTNISKHAEASTVDVRLAIAEGKLSLRIADDGTGFDPASTPRIGDAMGIRAMREMLESLSGGLTIDSTPGKGTAVTAALPYSPVQPQP